MLVCIPCIKGQISMSHAYSLSLTDAVYTCTVGGAPAVGSTSISTGATVPTAQSSAHQSTLLASGQQPTMQQAQPSQLGQQQSTHQAPQSHQGEQPQMPQFQQPIGMLS